MTPRSAHPIPGYETLLRRVEEATGPDRDLDRALAIALTGNVDWDAPSYTDSIDACMALIARLLPKWSLCLSLSEGLRHPNVAMGRSYPTNKTVTVEHRTAPLTILAALLKALSALPPIDEKPEAQASDGR